MSSLLAGRAVRWALGTVALCLALLVVAWFLLISPRRDETALLREQTNASDYQASLLQVELAQLKSQAADLPKQKKRLEEIAKELPPDADLPQYIRTLDSISTQAGTDLNSITPGAPVLVTLAASTSSGADAGSSGTAAGSGETVAGTTGAASGLGSPGDLVSIPMNLELGGDYYQLSSWLKSLQSDASRSYMVSAFTLTANEEDDGAAGLVGARIADGEPAASTPTASSSGKGQEGAVPTATDPSAVVPTTDATATPTVTGTDGTGTTGTATDTAAWSLSLTGTVFVLLTEDSTLEDVKADAAAAQASLSGTWTEVTPEPTATATSTAVSTATTTPTDPGVGAS